MSWGEIFFGFSGRINRKTYWIGSFVIAVLGLLFIGLLAYLATGRYDSLEIWRRPADQAALWAPVWLAYFMFLAWPSSAIAVKRLHDRGRPAWLWYSYYLFSAILSFVPVKAAGTSGTNPIFTAALIVLLIFGAYVMFELAVLRGTPGHNAHGEDPLPSDYYGGDYSFLSLMLAFEGRIGRKKWWLGMGFALFMIIGALIAIVILFNAFIASHPGLEEKLSDPGWLKSKDAEPVAFQLGLRVIVPAICILLALWSVVALGVKRLHDRGLSSWLILVVVLPMAGALTSPSVVEEFELGDTYVSLAFLFLLASVIWSILQFGILKGETGPNSHGADPLAGHG
jgi:uncharacterized membrane protein YhaH (DUF805 family)